MYRLLCLPYNETADVFALGLVILEMINNNVYPFGKPFVGSGGSGGGGQFADDEDNYIASPIDLLGEFEHLDVNVMLDTIILPNAVPNMGASLELREFLKEILKYDANVRPTAL